VTACTERALYVGEDVAEAEARAASCDRLYVGSETCETLFPGPERARRLIEAARGHGRPLTLVTPACTDAGLARVQAVLALLPAGSEVVFNDWGVFELLQGSALRPVLGRQLVRIPRGFRRAGARQLSPELTAFVRHSNLDNREFQELLAARAIARVELDNVLQGYSFRPRAALRASLHLPYVYIASGRKCLCARLEESLDAYRTGRPCRRSCRGLTLLGQVGDSDERVLISGNAHYYENGVLPAELSEWNVDRLVDCTILGRASL
jgi:hypothetical protein